MDEYKKQIGVLFDPRHERFAQHVAAGHSPREAKKLCNLPTGGKWSAKRLMLNQEIRARIDEIMQYAAKRAALSREGIIKEVQEEWSLARLAGQHAAALKAAEMLGSELHNMFRNKVEIGRAGEFDGKSEEELKEFILKSMRELGIEEPEPAPQQIEDHSKETIN